MLDGTTSVTLDSVKQFLMTLSHKELQGDNKMFNLFAYVSRVVIIVNWAKEYMEYLLGYHQLVNIIQKMLENMSQLAHTILQFPML